MRTVLICGIVSLSVALASCGAGILIGRYAPAWTSGESIVPVLLEPNEGAVLKKDQHHEWKFTWTKVPKADRYHIYIAHVSLADMPAVSQEVEVPFFRMQNIGLTQWKSWTWKVKARVDGEWSAWSEVRSFDVAAD